MLEHGYYKCCHLFRFGLVRSYGLLSEPDLASSAFDEMQRLQIWQPSHVKTANALLNALYMQMQPPLTHGTCTLAACLGPGALHSKLMW